MLSGGFTQKLLAWIEAYDTRFTRAHAENAAPEDQQFDYPTGSEKIMLVNLIDPEKTPDGSGSLWFKLPKQELKLLVRLEIGAMLFAPMNIDTVVVDLEAMQLTLVRRTQVSAKADVRQLELGTWPDDTKMETSAEMAAWIAEQNQANASRATSAAGNARGPHHG